MQPARVQDLNKNPTVTFAECRWGGLTFNQSKLCSNLPFEQALLGALPMTHDHNHPPSIRDAVNLETMTVRELGEVAEQYGMRLLDVLTL